jgi:hypothetical protein
MIVYQQIFSSHINQVISAHKNYPLFNVKILHTKICKLLKMNNIIDNSKITIPYIKNDKFKQNIPVKYTSAHIIIVSRKITRSNMNRFMSINTKIMHPIN